MSIDSRYLAVGEGDRRASAEPAPMTSQQVRVERLEDARCAAVARLYKELPVAVGVGEVVDEQLLVVGQPLVVEAVAPFALVQVECVRLADLRARPDLLPASGARGSPRPSPSGRLQRPRCRGTGP